MSKQIPNSRESEEAVIGSVLLDNTILAQLDLCADDFFGEEHRLIFKAIERLQSQKVAIDSVTLGYELGADLEAVGGAGMLSYLISICPSSVTGRYYAQIVKDCAINRSLIVASGEIAKLGYGNESPSTNLEKCQQMITSVGKKVSSSDILTPRVIAEMADIRYAYLRNTAPGIASGLSEFDEMTGGMAGGDYIILAARAGLGKTTLALQIARHIAIERNVLFVSLEMMPGALIDKITASITGKPVRVIRHGNYSDENYGDIVGSLGQLDESNLHLASGAYTTQKLRQVIERMRMAYGVELVVVDYLQILRDNYGRSSNERVGHISGELASFSKEFDIPLLVLSQLNRATDGRDDKRPHLVDLRESGSLEQDADMVLFLYRDSYYTREGTDTTAELIIAKDRLRGVTGTIKLNWDFRKGEYL